MNSLIVKYQLMLLTMIIAITTSMVIGINSAKNLNPAVNLNPNFSSLTRPVEWKVENQKTVAKLNNQNFFQSIINPVNQKSEKSNQIAHSIPVLLYHGVVEKPDGENVTVEQFRNQLITLKKAGYNTITLEQLEMFNKGEITLPEKSFMITFDDGRKDSFYPVDPILEALGYTAVTYIITKQSVDVDSSTYYLTEKELEKVQQTGRWEIESHSRNAHNLTKISKDGKQGSFYGNKLWLDNEDRLETAEEYRTRVKNDLAEAKIDLESTLNKKVTSIALPFGDYGQDSENFPEAPEIMRQEAGQVYSLVMYQTWADNYFNESLFNYPNPQNQMIKRIDVKSDWSAEKLLEVFTTYQHRNLPFSGNFEKNTGWIKNWGEMDLHNKSMFIGSTDNTNGSLVFLSGGLNWQNYSFKALIDWLGGEDATLVARFKDNKNYLSCSFGDGQVSIVQRVEGIDEVFITKKGDFVLQPYGTTLGLIVTGNSVSCSVEGDEIVSTDKVSEKLAKGSIGFASWDRNPHNSAILIKNVNVEEVN